MTYAGRLDPMASGLLLILVGEAVHEKEKYLGWDKEYKLEVLFGASTDTYDILGIVCPPTVGAVISTEKIQSLTSRNWTEYLQKYAGTFLQEYPPYSSKTVEGKQLHTHAREGTLDDIEMPTKEVTIHTIDFLKQSLATRDEIEKNIYQRIALVTGDFRQEEIDVRWKQFFLQTKPEQFCILELRVACSSGTYMRSLADRIGKDLGIPALAWNITRTRFLP
jgi:tRNA pseudouridine(55) synthase